MTDSTRDRLLDRLRTDLIGPEARREVLEQERPSDRYLTGILYCQNEEIPDEENEAAPESAGEPDQLSGETSREEIGLHRAFRPSSMGLSFVVSSDTEQLEVQVTGGRYVRRWEEDDGELTDQNLGRKAERWMRREVEIRAEVYVGEAGFSAKELALDTDDGPSPDLSLGRQVDRHGPDSIGVTLVLSNEAQKGEGPLDALQLHQAKITVRCRDGEFRSKGGTDAGGETRDARVNALLYRNRQSFASGHTCSAEWTKQEGNCVEVRSNWLPTATVYPISHEGDRELADLNADPHADLFSAGWLARQENPEALAEELRKLPERYDQWIERQREAAGGLDPEFQAQAEENLDRCATSADRMREGIRLLKSDEVVRRAFRLSQESMDLQHREEPLRWRPFQLGFQLQALASTANRDHSNRSLMDLLWFPTGGGKTEAYLGLAAFVLFHRRLREPTPDGDGRGVGVVTRYTLRLLTIQQFERTAQLVCACEGLRSGILSSDIDTSGLGDAPFTVGLWAGTSATPNRRSNARSRPESARVLEECPWCKERLPSPTSGAYKPVCENEECQFGAADGALPVLTVDEDIYEDPPSILIGTIDKFAQLVRKEAPGRLFGANTDHAVPDLVIQDELHLISGPLGTLAGLYETAIDILCDEQGRLPKVIGSTATIRGAGSQVLSLFNRQVAQFPPPAIDADNSFFAVEDREASGRKYVGVSTAGRSAKFALQTVCASLLQGTEGLREEGVSEAEIDPYWTLLAYFNSLRELGGALSLMEDDVRNTIKAITRRRGEQHRLPNPPTELTSRVSSEEIPRILKELEKSLDDDGWAKDTVLATNMISVGMDVPRLGLMVVNGQPKTMAEYIQATSRVGRRHPGLIVTLFNAMKTRDRSRFESFASWHRTLYRQVEASSVTPFAPRARDKALRAAIVALCRHLVEGMGDDPTLDEDRRQEAERLAQRIVRRASEVTEDGANEAAEVEHELQAILDEWEMQGNVERYWATVPSHADSALMVGAERHAAAGGDGSSDWTSQLWPTPNSMREVEPSVDFRLPPRTSDDR